MFAICAPGPDRRRPLPGYTDSPSVAAGQQGDDQGHVVAADEPFVDDGGGGDRRFSMTNSRQQTK